MLSGSGVIFISSTSIENRFLKKLLKQEHDCIGFYYGSSSTGIIKHHILLLDYFTFEIPCWKDTVISDDLFHSNCIDYIDVFEYPDSNLFKKILLEVFSSDFKTSIDDFKVRIPAIGLYNYFNELYGEKSIFKKRIIFNGGSQSFEKVRQFIPFVLDLFLDIDSVDSFLNTKNEKDEYYKELLKHMIRNKRINSKQLEFLEPIDKDFIIYVEKNGYCLSEKLKEPLSIIQKELSLVVEKYKNYEPVFINISTIIDNFNLLSENKVDTIDIPVTISSVLLNKIDSENTIEIPVDHDNLVIPEVGYNLDLLNTDQLKLIYDFLQNITGYDKLKLDIKTKLKINKQ